MAGWHHRLNGHEFEQALGDGEGQGGLACCSPWGRKESDMPENRTTIGNPTPGLTMGAPTPPPASISERREGL